MALVTFQVLDGLERGMIFADIPTPLTIGREEDNAIQLNDERVSRFHLKIQEDNGLIILTDLDSTNGTRVNGRPVQIHVLQVGDQISIGRCLLLFGSPEQIRQRVAELRKRDTETAERLSGLAAVIQKCLRSPRRTVNAEEDELPEMDGLLFPDKAPPLPNELTLRQRAQLTDVLAFVHEQLLRTIDSGEEVEHKSKPGRPRKIDWSEWQRLLQLEMQLASYLRQLAEPE